MNRTLSGDEANQLMESLPDPNSSASSLDQDNIPNNHFLPDPNPNSEPVLKAQPCHCNSPFCPHCNWLLKRKLHDKWLPILSTFKNLHFITLTISPNLFKNGKEAMEYVRKKGCIGRLMDNLRECEIKAMKNKGEKWFYSHRYAWVMEIQGNGFPHFHIILDARFIDHRELQHLWSLNRPKRLPPPQIGEIAFGTTWFVKQYEGQNSAEAANRLLNYLTKVPKEGYPCWLMEMGGRNGQIRRFGVSHNFYPHAAKQQRATYRRNSIRSLRKRRSARPGRTHAERLATCGSTTRIMETLPYDPMTGELRRTSVFLAEIDVAKPELLQQNIIRRDGTLLVAPGQDVSLIVQRISQKLGRPVHLIRRSSWRPTARRQAKSGMVTQSDAKPNCDHVEGGAPTSSVAGGCDGILG